MSQEFAVMEVDFPFFSWAFESIKNLNMTRTGTNGETSATDNMAKERVLSNSQRVFRFMVIFI